MKVTYANNICGDYVNLNNLIEASKSLESDILILGGDFIATPFFDPGKEHLKDAREKFIYANTSIRGIAGILDLDVGSVVKRLSSDKEHFLADFINEYDLLLDASKTENFSSGSIEEYQMNTARKVLRSLCSLYSLNTKNIIDHLSDNEKIISKDLAKDYLELAEIAEKGMKNQYSLLENMIKDAKESIPTVLLIHGGGDGDTIEDFETLSGCNLHLRHPNRGKTDIKGQKVQFAGYGSSPFCPEDLPVDMAEPYFTEAMCSHFVKSEPREFGIPYIIVSQVPPCHKITKQEDGNQISYLFGDKNFLDLTEKEQPDMILSGCLEMNPGIFEIGYSKVINPGPLNRQRGGNFAVMDINSDGLRTLDFYNIIDPEKCMITNNITVDYTGEKSAVIDHTKKNIN